MTGNGKLTPTNYAHVMFSDYAFISQHINTYTRVDIVVRFSCIRAKLQSTVLKVPSANKIPSYHAVNHIEEIKLYCK